jgi:nudix-type nucleoside diphosphatase (YffH/AdpP family)
MAEKTKPIVPARVNRSAPTRVWDGFFKLDTYRASYERYDNTMSQERTLEVFERGDAVAALLFDIDTDEVLLVEQFRLPTLLRGGSGWIVETAAGMFKGNESPAQCLRREVLEETGFQIADLKQIGKFFVSPGGTTERIFLFYAEVRSTMSTATSQENWGQLSDAENIRRLAIPIDEFFAKLEHGTFEDAKLIIAAQWLRLERARRPAERSEETSRTVSYRCIGPTMRRQKSEKIVGYKTGSISAVKDVDVWVNPTDTDMILDAFRSRTVSATIRRLGAEKALTGEKRIRSDTIGADLRRKLGDVEFVEPTTVIDTTPGALKETHNVRRIFHIAVCPGSIGNSLQSRPETLEDCVDEVLAKVENGNRSLLGTRPQYRSVLFPILGTGQGGFFSADVIPRLVRRAIAYFEDNPSAGINKIYFCGYTQGDVELLKQEFQKGVDAEQLERMPDEAQRAAKSPAPGRN